MPGKSKLQKKPVQKMLKERDTNKILDKMIMGTFPHKPGGVPNASPRDPSASQRKPLGTFDPTKGTWTPMHQKKQRGS